MDKFFALNREKQDTILNAALRCFGRFGYDKTSVSDIAMAAHISKASVFQYFGSKKQLYSYLLDYSMEIILPSFDQAALDSETDLFDRILISGKMKMAVLKSYPFVTQFIAGVWEEASPEVSDLLASLKEKTGRFRSEMVLREEDGRRFKNPGDVEAVYHMLLLMADGYSARYRSKAEFDFEFVMEDFERNIAVLKRNFYKEEYV